MKVVVLSDLHIDENCEWVNITQEMCRRVKNIIKQDEAIRFIILGDIINGIAGRSTDAVEKVYRIADEFIDYINDFFSNYNIGFYFVPGNHDLYVDSLEPFNDFIERHSKINSKSYRYTLKESIFYFEEENIRFILIDSNFERNFEKRGKIDGELLKKYGVTNKTTVLFMHHPPMLKPTYSNDPDNDKSLLNPLDIKYLHAKYVFYGHIHGDNISDFDEEKNTLYVPVSGLLNKGKFIKNGFTVLDIKNESMMNCYNYEYNGNRFFKTIVGSYKEEIQSCKLRIEMHDYSLELENTIKRFYNQYNCESENLDIINIIDDNDFIVISGEAGIGKTLEARRIYQYYKENEEFYPIIIDLRCATDDLIKEYLDYASNFRIDNKDVMLIVDGLSEVTLGISAQLLPKLKELSLCDCQSKIIVTKRSNFDAYDYFEHYKEFQIKEFDNGDVSEYIEKRGVKDSIAFYNALKSDNYNFIIGNPFLLKEITSLYLAYGKMPKFQDFFHHVISLRFIEADKRIDNQYRLMDNEYELLTSLEEFGFAMMIMNKHPLENIHYSKLFKESFRKMHSYTGLLDCYSNYCRDFIHDIYSEYLVADYLCKLDLEQLLKIITYNYQGEERVKRTWYDVVRRLIDMRLDDELLVWVLDNDNEFIFYNIPEKTIVGKQAILLVKKLIKKCCDKNMPVHLLVADVKKFVDAFSSKEMWEYVIEELKSQDNENTLYSLLLFLQYAKAGYDSDIVQSVLINIIKENKVKRIKSAALKALLNINANANDYLEIIINEFHDENDKVVVKNIFEMICKSDNPDQYYNYAIEKFEHSDKSYIVIGYNECFLKLISSLKYLEGILDCIMDMCESDTFANVSNTNKIFYLLINKITHFYLDDTADKAMIFDRMIECFKSASYQLDGTKTKIVKDFFVKVKKVNDALLQIINDDNSIVFYSCFENLFDSTMIETVINCYNDGSLSDDRLIWYVNRYSIVDQDKSKLMEAYKIKNGSEIPLIDKHNWQNNRKFGEIKYLESLFDKKAFESKLHEIVSLVGANFKISDFFDKYFSVISDERIDLRMIGSLIYRIACNTECYVDQFFSYYNWDDIQFISLVEFLETKDKFDLDDIQRRYLQEKFEKIITEVNFETIDYKKFNDYDSRISLNVRFVITLISKYDFQCDEETILEMLMIPWFMFNDSNTSGSSAVLSFVASIIKNKKKLHDRIIENLQYKNLNIFAQETHLIYCLDNNISIAVKNAVDLFKSTESEAIHRKDVAIKYLLKFKDEQFVDALISDQTEDEVLEYLVPYLKISNSKLISELLLRNQNSSDYFLFVRELIELNNVYGLKKYIDFVKEKLTIPELSDEFSGCDITFQLRKITDESLMADILSILPLAYTSNFNDKDDVWGLKASLDYVITNISRDKPEVIYGILNEYLNADELCDELKFRLNYYIQICENTFSTLTDGSWSFDQAYDYICARRKQRLEA